MRETLHPPVGSQTPWADRSASSCGFAKFSSKWRTAFSHRRGGSCLEANSDNTRAGCYSKFAGYAPANGQLPGRPAGLALNYSTPRPRIVHDAPIPHYRAARRLVATRRVRQANATRALTCPHFSVLTIRPITYLVDCRSAAAASSNVDRAAPAAGSWLATWLKVASLSGSDRFPLAHCRTKVST